MDRFLITSALAVIFFTLALCYTIPVNASKSESCGVYSTQMFELSGLSTIASDTFEYEFNEAKGLLAQSACADLKPDNCGLGACKNGWKCQANVTQCMCFPPN